MMSYMIAGGQTLNLVFCRTDTSDPITWKQSDSLDEMKRFFHGWDPTLVQGASYIARP